MINGTQLEDLSLTNVETVFSQTSNQGILVFRNISVEYNNTNIQCRATLSNGETVDSNNFTLLVQGERVIERAKRAHSLVMTFEIFHIMCIYLRTSMEALFRV